MSDTRDGVTTDLANLSRKGLLRHIAQQNEALITGQRYLANQFTTFQETVLMQLNQNEQEIINALNDSTNKVGEAVTDIAEAVTDGIQAITDLFNNQSTVTLADVQPQLNALNDGASSLKSAASALKAIATEKDPLLTPTAPPVVIENPDGTSVPVSTPPTDGGTGNPG